MTTTPEREEFEAPKDHEIARVVNELRDIAITYRETQQLRERIANAVVPLLKAATAAARQSAPESCRKVSDCTESLCMQANRCKHTLPPQPQRLCVEQSEDRRDAGRQAVSTAPERIWLQISDDTDHFDEPFPRGPEADVTWCEDIGSAECEVEYVRADLAAMKA